MSDIRTLVEYLNPRKQGGSGSGGYEYHYIRIDEEFLNENQDINSDGVHRVIEYKIESPLSSQFTKISIESNLVVALSLGELKYYLQKKIDGKTKYLSFYNLKVGNTEDRFLEELTNVNVIPINERDSFYYHKHQDAIYIQNIRLADVVVNFRRSLYYDPKQLGGLKNGTYYLDYTDAKGYSGGFLDTVIGDIVREIDFESNMSKRTVAVELNPKKGNLKWYPDKVINQDNQITLFYDYHPTENDDFEVDPLKEDFGIKLTFKDVEGFLGFMVITYFNNGVSILNTTEGTNKYNFCKKYIDIIYLLLNRSENNVLMALTYLYYVPLEVFEKEIKKYRDPKNNETSVIGANYLWKVIGVALEGLLTNFGVNNEDIVLKLLHAIKITQNDAEYQSKEKNDEILNILLTRKTSTKNSYLLTLYALMNTNSFVKFNTYIYLLWRTSSFTNPHNKIFSKTSQLVNANSKNTPQLVLPYKTKELIGFYSSNMNIEFTNHETIVVTPNESAITNVLKVITPDLGEIIENMIEEDWKAEYHPLQPVFVADASKDKAIEVQRLSPMLLLKANEDKSFWINMATATEYGVDTITTLSGIGNLAKFRHLARIVKTAQTLNKGKKFIRTFTVFKFVQGAIAGAEITAGTVNALLKITGIKNTKLGRAISEFLFWLELASLSGEIGAAITKGLQKSAKTIIDNVDDFEKSLDDLVRRDELDEVGKNRITREIDSLIEVVGESIEILKTNPAYLNALDFVKRYKIYSRYMVAEKAAMIRLYTGSTYLKLNRALRGLGGSLDGELVAMQRLLDEALSKLPNSHYNKGVLKRSAYFSDEMIDTLFKGQKTFKEKGFFSTTYSDEALKLWLIDNPHQNVIFKVQAKNAKLIEDASMLPHEAELLFKSGTEFEIIRTYKDISPVDNLKKMTFIILKEI